MGKMNIIITIVFLMGMKIMHRENEDSAFLDILTHKCKLGEGKGTRYSFDSFIIFGLNIQI